MSTPFISTSFIPPGAVEVTERHWAFPEFIHKTSRDLSWRIEKIESPKDIEDTIFSEISFVRVIFEQLNRASDVDRFIYKVLGVKTVGIIELHQDIEIALSWIEWYKEKRTQDAGAIRKVEAFLPTVEFFKVYRTWFNFRKLRLVVKTNFIPPGSGYVIDQAKEYARVLYNIFCTPFPAPAPGQPLSQEPEKPDLEEVPKTRTSLGKFLFEDNEPYATFEARVVKHFLNSAIATGITSPWLPHVPVDSPGSLPDDHPIKLNHPLPK